jgi:large repetitive protein
LTVTADAKSKVYGQLDPALTYQITAGALVSGDSLTGALTREAGETVGVYAIQQGSLTAGGNYAVTFVGANLTIAQAALTVTADAKSKVYGQLDPALTYQITAGALVSGDSLTGALTREAGETVGVYAIQQGSLTAGGNYAVTFVGANLTIAQAGLTVTADAKSKVYGQLDPALTYQITAGALVSGDSLTGALTREAGETVGVYGIQQGSLTAGGNYAVTFVGANLTIAQAALTVTADAKSKVYGQLDPALTYQITAGALVSGDSLTGALTREAGENVGVYAILQGTLTAGSNYTVTYVGNWTRASR